VSDWKNIFPSYSTVEASTTSPITVNTSEVNLRVDFNALVLGESGETPIGQPFILRRMRLDDNENKIACVCVNSVTNEPERDYPCSYCYGAGYLWDEELVTGYKVVAASPAGTNAASNLPKATSGHLYVPATKFFLPYDVNPKRHDRIIEIELDEEGDAVTPYNRVAVYETQLIRAMRGDNGKIEFWVIIAQRMGPDTLGSVS